MCSSFGGVAGVARERSWIAIPYLGGYSSGTEISTERSLYMNAISAQEIKRRGITAVDELIAKGDLHVIRNNQPQYVVLSEERYQDLIVAEQEAHYARARASLEDVKGGKVKKFKTAADLLKALDADETA